MQAQYLLEITHQKVQEITQVAPIIRYLQMVTPNNIVV